MSYKFRRLTELQKECQKYLDNKNYSEVISIYEKMFEISKDYIYKLSIANIHYKCLNNLAKATEMYNELRPKLEHLPSFWWQNFEIQSNNSNIYEATYSVYKAIELENLTKIKEDTNA